jgi:hypothetical protein
MSDIHSEVISLLKSMRMGHMGGVAYDTARLAMLRDGFGKVLFPRALWWLLKNQSADGSWGADGYYYHDRLLSTLASVITLSRTDPSRYKEEINRGESFIWNNIRNLDSDPHETIGFELIFPALIKEAEGQGLNLPYHANSYRHAMEAKMALISPDQIYSGRTSTAFSLEFLGEDLDLRRVLNTQSGNGSIQNSPSATAFMYSKTRNTAAYEYLRKVYSFNGGSIMSAYPFEVFEKSWVLYNFYVSGLGLPSAGNHLLDLQRLWSPKGLSFSEFFATADSDDTAVAFKLLYLSGKNPDPAIFERFESDGHFRCYDFERNASVSANIHILDAVKDCINWSRRDEVVEKILTYLSGNTIGGNHWVCKWQCSPYYATSHAVIAISGLDISLVERAKDWIVDTQNPDGSWGNLPGVGGNPEETAYAMQGLLHYHNEICTVDDRVLSRGVEYLHREWGGSNWPQLWILKGLYTPVNVARSAVLGAMYGYRSLFGTTSERWLPCQPALKEPVLTTTS